MSSSAAKETPPSPRDHIRESLETLVFVVVLVLILQLFVLEAFVIPTGSMAETQLGYHKNATCQQCAYQFPVNCSDEVERPSRETRVYGYSCPNCQFKGSVDWNGDISPTSGDRVLVHKAMSPDERGRVVVFKYPVAPQNKQQAQNYIKRCIGFGGETIATQHGDLYVTTALTYPKRNRPESPLDAWMEPYCYSRDPDAVNLFEESRRAMERGSMAVANGFVLYRKPDELALEMRRLVFDNNFQPADIASSHPRWTTRPNDAKGWAPDTGNRAFTHRGDESGWIGYRHLSRLREGDTTAQKIVNSMGYNGGLGYLYGGDVLQPLKSLSGGGEDYWVSDLMVECTADFEAGSEVTLELSKGAYRYRATFANGQVMLSRFETAPPPGAVVLNRSLPSGWKTEPSRPVGFTAGKHALRFANFDCRLRVWVDNTPIDFGTDSEYAPTDSDFAEKHPNNTEAPIGIGARGNVAVSNLKVWRDTYYTPQRGGGESVDTYYVQPGHYLCFGDNSAQSSDGRMWGSVPERLMIGRAVFTFFPIHRIGVIR